MDNNDKDVTVKTAKELCEEREKKSWEHFWNDIKPDLISFGKKELNLTYVKSSYKYYNDIPLYSYNILSNTTVNTWLNKGYFKRLEKDYGYKIEFKNVPVTLTKWHEVEKEEVELTRHGLFRIARLNKKMVKTWEQYQVTDSILEVVISECCENNKGETK